MGTAVTSTQEDQQGSALVGLSRTAQGDPVPLAAERATARPGRTDAVGVGLSWLAAWGMGVFAFLLRWWHLAQPHSFAFDETYYAKDAWSLLHFGYAQSYVAEADGKILDGTTTGLWTGDASMVVHPELGKWLIALGEQAFGMNPFGWRIAAAVVGSLMVVVMCRLGRRLTGSTLLGCLAGLLLAVDGMHLVLSRLALLDIFVAFFLLCAIACLVNDRFWFRARLAARQSTASGPPGSNGWGPEDWGPVRGLLLRPWLALAGVSFGLATACKWEVLYPLAAFGVLSWLWSAGARRSFGIQHPIRRSALADGPAMFAHLVLVGFVVYLSTWTGWLLHASAYEQELSNTQYTHYAGGADWPTRDEPDAQGFGEVTQSLRSLAHYHRDVYVFHRHFLNGSEHSYASQPWGWLLLNRPVGVSADNGIQPGAQGCAAPVGSDCLRQVLLLGNPVIWWGGVVALLFALAMWVGARDWRYGLAVVGTASTWLPWLLYDERPIFIFYAVVTLPFLVIALVLAAGRLIGAAPVPSRRRTLGVIAVGTFVVLSLISFAWFWPVWTNELLTHRQWLARIWFDRWV